ncbi:MAG: carboxypeptidase-like regulatory domain-containing protein [Bryobacteraceae bacterium]|nr:carboxypeptidase-like regulatory domain-containing protein [Bryobacteraceae bacterium]
MIRMTSRLALVLPLVWVVMAQPPPSIPARRPASQSPRVPLSPEDYGAVEGMIVNALTGEALRKATVRVRRTDGQGRGASFSATTDASGRYAISDLEPGAYRVTAERNGFVESEYGARGTRRQGSPVNVGKGQRVRDIQVRLTPHGVIALQHLLDSQSTI